MKKSDDELESSSVSSETDVNGQASKKSRLSRDIGITTFIAQSDPHSSGDESKGSSNPSIIATTNQDLILTISEVTDDKGHLNAMLSLSDTRPNTHLGAEQGDHVTAYVNFLQVLITNVETMELQKAVLSRL